MRKKTKGFISVVLCILMLLGTFSIAAVVFSAKAETVQEYSDLTICLQELSWYNHQTNNFNVGTFSSVTQKADAGRSGSYVDENDVVYYIKVVNNTTAQITSVATPIGMEEIHIPAQVVLCRLINKGYNKVAGTETSFNGNYFNDDGGIYSWNFSADCKYTYDKEGNLTSLSEPIVAVDVHTYQIVDVTKSFSSTQTTVKKVILPSLIKTINANAFADNPYINEVVGYGVQEVASKSFYNCKNLINATFPNLRYVRESAFYKCNALKDLDFSNVLCIGSQAFFDCVKFTKVNFSSELQQLESQAFKQCTGITEINFPAGISISTIPEQCFYLCSSLKEVKLPYEIINIGKQAFYNCTTLRQLDFRNTNLDTVGEQAFWGCSRLSYVILPETLVTFKTNAFDNCTELRYVYFSHQLTDAQIKSLQKSNLADCVITEVDKYAPSIYNETEDLPLTGNTLYVYKPSTIVVYDIIDVDSVEFIENPVTTKVVMSKRYNTYPTYTVHFDVTKKGTYKFRATDILGNTKEYTLVYTNMPGDINMDGGITAADARLALRASVGLEHYAPGSEKFVLADYNQDGTVSASDARSILRAAVGLDPFDADKESAKNPVKIKKGDTMFELDGTKVIYLGSTKDANGKYSVNVKFVNNTDSMREIVLMWMCDGTYYYCYNTRLNSNHVYGNTVTLNHISSISPLTMYCKVLKSNAEDVRFSGMSASDKINASTAVSFQIV